jgi:hypothetical protein
MLHIEAFMLEELFNLEDPKNRELFVLELDYLHTPTTLLYHPVILHSWNTLRIYAKADTCDWTRKF